MIATKFGRFLRPSGWWGLEATPGAWMSSDVALRCRTENLHAVASGYHGQVLIFDPSRSLASERSSKYPTMPCGT